MIEFLASIGALTVLLGGFYFLLYYSFASDSIISEYEFLIKEAHWENYFWSWCQDPANVSPRTHRAKALKKFFTKERIKEANDIIEEYRVKKLREEVRKEVLEEIKNKGRGT